MVETLKNKKFGLIEIKPYGDERGKLVAFQEGINCPFEIRRCFYIFDTKDDGVVRGVHANRKSEFLLTVISGSCRVRVDTGHEKSDFLLDDPRKALYIDKMVWKEMYDFSDNSRLVVFSNKTYDENEYIRNYDEFLKEICS